MIVEGKGLVCFISHHFYVIKGPIDVVKNVVNVEIVDRKYTWFARVTKPRISRSLPVNACAQIGRNERAQSDLVSSADPIQFCCDNKRSSKQIGFDFNFFNT